MNAPDALPAFSNMDRERRFGGIARLYGEAALETLKDARVCVVGIGGVGSWTAETLARSGVGRLRLVDLDHVSESNINRQIHALEPTVGQAKVQAMRERIGQIDAAIELDGIEDFLTADNAKEMLADCDVVVDAVDDVRAKLAMVLFCRDAGVELVVCGGAGGKVDPTRIHVEDLARTKQDPLLASLRRRLRAEHGYSRDPKRKFGIATVYSDEPLCRPQAACGASAPQGLACAGYGSSMAVTASFGLSAAAYVIDALVGRKAQ